MVEAVIYDMLKTNGPASLDQVDVYFGVYPNTGGDNPNTKSWIVYYTNSTEPNDTKQGRSTLDVVNVQLNIFSYDALTLRTISMAVRNALDRKGGAGEVIYTDFDVQVSGIQFVNHYLSLRKHITTKGYFRYHNFMISE